MRAVSPCQQLPVMRVLYIGGPTALIEIGGLRLLTDPTFDPPGDYPIGSRKLTKLAPPALTAERAGHVDAVLLSHDHHPDNLDRAGRAYLETAPLVFSTASALERLGRNVRAVPNWEQVELPRPDGGTLRITGLPARHGPPGTESLVGEVTGFLLSGADLPAVYVSGDNAGLDVVETISDRVGRVDVALLFAGGARSGLISDAYLTLPSEAAADAARIIGARQVIPLHFEGWAHFSETRESLVAALSGDEWRGRVHILEPGSAVEV